MGSVHEFHVDPGAGCGVVGGWKHCCQNQHCSGVGGVWGEAAVFDQMVEMREEAEACWVLCISHQQLLTSPALSCEPCMKWTLGSNWGKGRERKGAPGARIIHQAWFSVGIFICKKCTKVMDCCDYKFVFVCNISNSWFLGIDQNYLVARNCSTHICLGKNLLLNSTLTGTARSLFSPFCSSLFPQLLQSTPGSHFSPLIFTGEESRIIRESPYLLNYFHEAGIYNGPER